MAIYKSNYPELSFYVNNERKQFSNGEYHTDDKKEAEVLAKLSGVTCDCETKPEPKPRATAKKK